MNLSAVESMARSGRLYPSLILHGGGKEQRREAAILLARVLLCERATEERSCGVCRHCRRIDWPAKDKDRFHPDFQVLERDLKTSTSVEATKALLQTAQVTPFEARGQVFVIANAETLSGEAANALLKNLEEPYTTSPRHFLLLAPSRFDLLPTIRSRSLALYLGSTQLLEAERVSDLADELSKPMNAYQDSGNLIHLLDAASVLEEAGEWKDPRASEPWGLAASAMLELARDTEVGERRRALLTLAEDLLGGPRLRVRGIAPRRILEGWLVKRLGCWPTDSSL